MTRRDWLIRVIEGVIVGALSFALGAWIIDAVIRFGG